MRLLVGTFLISILVASLVAYTIPTNPPDLTMTRGSKAPRPPGYVPPKINNALNDDLEENRRKFLERLDEYILEIKYNETHQKSEQPTMTSDLGEFIHIP